MSDNPMEAPRSTPELPEPHSERPSSEMWGKGKPKLTDNQTLIIDCPHWERLKSEDKLPNACRHWLGFHCCPMRPRLRESLTKSCRARFYLQKLKLTRCISPRLPTIEYNTY